MSDAWNRLAELPIAISEYELTDHDRQFGDFTRPSTSCTCTATARRGSARTSSTTCSTTSRIATPARFSTSPVPRRSVEVCALLGELDLFPGAAPSMEASRHYRRWAYESAALDLALRQNGLALWEAVERDPQPLRFVCSTRLSSFDEGSKSSTEQIRNRLAKYPDLEFKLDPENDWDQALIDEIAELAPVAVLDLKGMYSGTPVDVDTDPKLYLEVAEKFPGAYLEDPDINDDTRELLAPFDDRITWDAPLHSLADVQGDGAEGHQLEAVALRIAPGAALDLRLLRPQRDRRLRRRPGRAAVRARADPVPGLPLSRDDLQRRRAIGLQRPGGPLGDADQPDGPRPERHRLSLGRVAASNRAQTMSCSWRLRAVSSDRVLHRPR